MLLAQESAFKGHYKSSSVAEENGSTQKHSSESINTNKAKTATKSIVVSFSFRFVLFCSGDQQSQAVAIRNELDRKATKH